MKKFLGIVFAVFALLSTSTAQDYVVERTEKMMLPDGAKADVLFFKKWADAGKYLKAYTPAKGMKTMIGAGKIVKAKTETELGDFSKTYSPDENASVSKICEIMNETGSSFAFAWVPGDKKIRREQFNYKGGKLQYAFLDFFEETNKDYMAFKAGEDVKQEKINNAVGGVAKAILSPIGDGTEAATHKNETPEQTLYRLRHETHTLTSVGTYKTGGTKVLNYRYIYRDNGKMINEYVVDLDGNLRTNMPGTRFEDAYPLVEKYSVPKEIRDLAQKSLD